jgi:hypothetical protein
MRLPEFTAAMSLGRSNELYASMPSGVSRANTGAVTAQIFLGCTPCSPSGLQTCCTVSPYFGYVCRQQQCSPPPDPCAHIVKRCARMMCECEQNPTCICSFDSNDPCGFSCTGYS